MSFQQTNSYSVAAVSGTMAAGLGADAEIFQFRWISTTGILMVPTLVRISGGGIVAFTAGFGAFRMKLARAWTADGTGGTALAFTGDDNKKRTTMGTTVSSDTGVRIASTAALGAGTKTLDANAFATQTFGVTATAGTNLGFGETLWERNPDDHPVIFAQDEGFVITATVPATGTWTFGVTVEWSEYTRYA